MAMAPPSALRRRPLPPGLRMTPANRRNGKKDKAKSSGSGDESRDRRIAGTSHEKRRTTLRFAAGTNPPKRHVPPRRRREGFIRSNDEEDQSNTSKLGGEGNSNSNSGTRQEIERPRSTEGLSPSPRLCLVSPNTKTVSAREAENDSKARGPGGEGGGSPTTCAGQENIHPNVPAAPRIGRAVLANEGGSADRSRTPSPKKRKHERREKTLDSEYRRDLLAFEGIDVRDFQEEVDARQEAEAEESPKKKGKKAAPSEVPDRPLVSRNERSLSIPVRSLRAQVIAQTGFETHFERAISDTLDEEDLFTPDVEHIEQDSQHPVIIPICDGSRAQYPAGSTADRVGVQLGERQRWPMRAHQARIIRERDKERRKSREELAANAAAEAHATAVAHAAAVANQSDEEPVASDVDEEEGDGNLGDLALGQCSTL